MKFFNELLSSYSLLKKRKLHITLDEIIDTHGITWGKLLGMKGAEDPSSSVGQAIQSVTNIIGAIFPGAKPGSQGDAVTGFNANPPEGAELVKQFGIQQEQPEKAAGSNGEGETKESPDAACGGAVKWTGGGGRDPYLVKKDCTTSYNLKQYFTNAVVRYVFQAKAGEEGGLEGVGANEAPEMQEFTSTEVGARLFSYFRDNEEDNTTLGDVLKLQTLFSENEMWGRWGDVRDTNSVFSVIANSLENGEKEAVKLGTLGDLSVGDSIATEEEILGAISNLSDLLPKITDSLEGSLAPYETIKHIQDNLTLVVDEKGKTQLFINTGFKDLGVQLDGSQHKDLIENIERYNDKVKADTTTETLAINTIDRSKIRSRNTAGDLSTDVITAISENMDRLLLLMMQGRDSEVKSLYKELDSKYGENIYRALQAGEAVTEGGFAGTQDAEAWIAAHQNVVSNLPTFPTFVRIASSMREETVRKSGAIGIFRCGGMKDAGKQGLKADQVYIFDDQKKANKHFKKKAPQISLGELSDTIGISVDDMKKEWSLDKDWNDETQVFASWESLKFYTGAGITLGSVKEFQDTVSEAADFLSGDVEANQQWLEAMRDTIRVPDPTSKSGDRGLTEDEQKETGEVFRKIDEGLSLIDTLLDTESPTVGRDEIRKTLFASLGMDLPDDESLGAFSDNERAQANYDLKQKYTTGFIELGLRHKQQRFRDRYKNTAAYMIALAAVDRDNSLDVVGDVTKAGKKDAVETTSRNDTVREELRKFMASKKPMEDGSIRFKKGHNGFNVAGIAYATGTSAYKQKKGGSKVSGSVSITSRKGSKHLLDSTAYSNHDLMDKLLEVQHLIFSNLIKE